MLHKHGFERFHKPVNILVVLVQVHVMSVAPPAVFELQKAELEKAIITGKTLSEEIWKSYELDVGMSNRNRCTT